MSLLFLNKVKQNTLAFEKKVREISTALGINPNWLMFIMNNESGLNEQAYNPSGGAYGLIQFMPTTLSWLGTSTQAMKKLSNLQQLDWVYKYFKSFNKKYASVADLYLINFYPYALGKPLTYIFGSEKNDGLKYAKYLTSVNKGFDWNKDGVITLDDYYKYMENAVKNKVSKEYLADFIVSSQTTKTGLSIGFLCIIGAVFAYTLNKINKMKNLKKSNK